MHEAWELTSAPAAEPITRADLGSSHIRFSGSDEADLIDAKIVAARQHVERITGRQIITATWKLRLDRFPAGDRVIELRRSPVQSVESLTYVDPAGVEQTIDVADRRLDLYSEPARLTPVFGGVWPSTRTITNAVMVELKAGYGLTAATVPDEMRELLLKVLASLWMSRGDPTAQAINSDPWIAALMQSFVVEWLL